MVPVELTLVLIGAALLALQWALARRRPDLRAPFSFLAPARSPLPAVGPLLPGPRREVEAEQPQVAALV
jgi:hypothetical protein